jgi:hypothetical protein
MGCAPAYDEYFKGGLRKMKLTQTFNHDSFKEIIEFYKDNKKPFGRMKFKTAKNNLPYPPMKNLDLYFWAKGGGE